MKITKLNNKKYNCYSGDFCEEDAITSGSDDSPLNVRGKCPICLRIMTSLQDENTKETREHILNWEYFRNQLPVNPTKKKLQQAKRRMNHKLNVTKTCAACNDARNHAKQKTSIEEPIRYSVWSMLLLTDRIGDEIRPTAIKLTEDIDKMFWDYLAKKHRVYEP
jgi:hypothetical protein